MPASTVLNQRQHIGLQKLSALAGFSHSALGPNKTYKFIQDDASGESALVSSCVRLFENLELTCAVGQLVYETIQAHHSVYRTGSGSLLFLAGAWSRAALECLQRGISVSHIISAMSEGIGICLDVCNKCSIPVENLSVAHSESFTAMPFDVRLQQLKKPVVEPSQTSSNMHREHKVSQKATSTVGQVKIKLSRHFCETRVENLSTDSQPPEPQGPNIAHIAGGLSHGSADAMKLAVEASYLQSERNQQANSSVTFDISKVVTCLLPGLSEEHACVLPGCILLLSAEQASVARHLKNQHIRVALITGDLSYNYRHLGFSRAAGLHRVSDQPALLSSSKEDEWLGKVVTLLLSLEVNLILVSGLMCDTLIQCCCGHNILVVEKVKASILKTFASATGAVPVTYASQLSRQCVATGVKVELWRDLGYQYRKHMTAVNISTCRNSGLVTVILTSYVQGKLQALEDQFWACASRLHHALKDRALLPGAGETEMLCIHRLQKQAKYCTNWDGDTVQRATTDTGTTHYKGEVLHLMADGLIDYICTVMVNTGRTSKVRARTVVSQQLQDCNGPIAQFSQLFLEDEREEGVSSSPIKTQAIKIYDNLSVKQEAWRKALDVVFLVLQTDAELITGMDHETDHVEENVMLL
ncbi:Bardet-Biedl syndrome 12 protein [Betta splendens]|uniref:Bardet-Biedl syndrome 12 protein n=1 Tax=Betta splendens TaxID=158456 RepID=A0A6P7NW12_BETSP|nr:Bardet-Biedl syndrome 12 protein [Betta splendens]XP_029021736.1 Bardet-Biedl syndrome 12 protein [Betta splendens]XP_055368189.1 Bardet-Biedl syndrome 12 protein [Betta splendens]XP_055368190.1 Bardet-Biedl syndrome 12 protein [Betta splendens]XP_055368191.1 Bardet-Biedl syndrome 12 protein [Betta splendens]